MDYRDFLSDTVDLPHRLPYFGEGKVTNGVRHWKVREPAAIRPGWHVFEQAGRGLRAVDSIESELYIWKNQGLRGPLKGYQSGGRFIGDSHQATLFDLPKDEDLNRFTPVTAWEWFDGNLLFDGIDFETEVEEAVREAYDEESSIAEIKSVTPALANAFILETTNRELAREAVRRSEEERIRRELEVENEARLQKLHNLEETIEGRIAVALSHSGAELIDWRRSGNGQITVRYRIDSQRIECLIDAESLSIIDSGICLEGADHQLNLSSLPSTVQEAIDTGQLHVYRQG